MEKITEEYIRSKGFVQHASLFIKSGMVIYKTGNEWRFAFGRENIIVKNTTELGQKIYQYEATNLTHLARLNNPTARLDR